MCQNRGVNVNRLAPLHRGNHSEPVEALKLVCWLRAVAIAAQLAAIGVVHFGLDLRLPLGPLAVTLALLALWNVAVLASLRRERHVRPAEIALNLGVDVTAFTSVLYFTGGPANPFGSLYLVPISLAATSLPAAYAWGIAGACAAGYSLLWLSHVPLPSVHDRFGGDFDLHVAGMWINLLVAAALIVFFVGRMARLVRERDRELAAMREEALRARAIVELGTLAAGTAHELNTPLATLGLLVEELEETVTDDEERERLAVMREQLALINSRLNRIATSVGAERSQRASASTLEEFVRAVIRDWQRTHPNVEVAARYALEEPDLAIVVEATIEHAIRNVLDNAAQATLANGGDTIELDAVCRGGHLKIAVVDAGSGLDPTLRGEIGFKVVSTKEHGLGIGLLLSRAALERFGGRLELRSRPSGGVEAEIDLPLDELRADAR